MLYDQQLQEFLDTQVNKFSRDNQKHKFTPSKITKDNKNEFENMLQTSQDGKYIYYLQKGKYEDGSQGHLLIYLNPHTKYSKSLKLQLLDTDSNQIQNHPNIKYQISQTDSRHIIFYSQNQVFALIIDYEEYYQETNSDTIEANQLNIPQLEKKKWGSPPSIINITSSSIIGVGVIAILLTDGVTLIYNMLQSIEDPFVCLESSQIQDITFGTSKNEYIEPCTLFQMQNTNQGLNIVQRYVPELRNVNIQFSQKSQDSTIYIHPSEQQQTLNQQLEICNPITNLEIQFYKIQKLHEFQNIHVFLLYSIDFVQILFTNLEIEAQESTEAFIIDVLEFSQENTNQENTIEQNIPKLVGKIENSYYFQSNQTLWAADFKWLKDLDEQLKNSEAQEDIESLQNLIQSLENSKSKSKFGIIHNFQNKKNSQDPQKKNSQDQLQINICMCMNKTSLIVLDQLNKLWAFDIKLTQHFVNHQESFFAMKSQLEQFESNQNKEKLKQRQNMKQTEIKNADEIIAWNDLSPRAQQNQEVLKKTFEAIRGKKIAEVKSQLEKVRLEYYPFISKIQKQNDKIQTSVTQIERNYLDKIKILENQQIKLQAESQKTVQRIQNILSKNSQSGKNENGLNFEKQIERDLSGKLQLIKNKQKQVQEIQDKYLEQKEKVAQQLKEYQSKQNNNSNNNNNNNNNQNNNNIEDLMFSKLTSNDKQAFKTIIKQCQDTCKTLDSMEIALKSEKQL